MAGGVPKRPPHNNSYPRNGRVSDVAFKAIQCQPAGSCCRALWYVLLPQALAAHLPGISIAKLSSLADYFDHPPFINPIQAGRMQCRGEHNETCGHGHHHHHHHGDECDHEMEDPDGQSMFAAIDTSKVRCLNESAAGSCAHPFKPYSRVRTYTSGLERAVVD